MEKLNIKANVIKKYYRRYCLKNSIINKLQTIQTIFIRRYSYYYTDVKKLPNIICCHKNMNLHLLKCLKVNKDRNIKDIIVWMKKIHFD